MASDQNSLLSFNAGLTYNVAPVLLWGVAAETNRISAAILDKLTGAIPHIHRGVVSCNLRLDVYHSIVLARRARLRYRFSVAASSRR